MWVRMSPGGATHRWSMPYHVECTAGLYHMPPGVLTPMVLATRPSLPVAARRCRDAMREKYGRAAFARKTAGRGAVLDHEPLRTLRRHRRRRRVHRRAEHWRVRSSNPPKLHLVSGASLRTNRWRGGMVCNTARRLPVPVTRPSRNRRVRSRSPAYRYCHRAFETGEALTSHAGVPPVPASHVIERDSAFPLTMVAGGAPGSGPHLAVSLTRLAAPQGSVGTWPLARNSL